MSSILSKSNLSIRGSLLLMVLLDNGTEFTFHGRHRNGPNLKSQNVLKCPFEIKQTKNLKPCNTYHKDICVFNTQ